MTPLLTFHLTNPPLLLTHNPPPALTPTLATASSGLQFRHKLLYLESLSINSLTAVTKNPTLRTTPLDSLLSLEQTLTTSFGLPRSSLGRIFDMFPQLLTIPTSHLHLVLDFLLNDVVLPFPDVSRAVIRCPRLLISDVHSQLMPTLRFLRPLLGKTHLSSHHTVLLVSSIENTLIPKLNFLKDSLGFREAEVVNMVQRSPALLTYSIDNNLKPKLEFLVEEMKRDAGEIKEFPQYFSFSLEKRIVPRHRLLVEHRWCSMSLRDMLKVSDGEFNVRLLERRLRLIDRGLLL